MPILVAIFVVIIGITFVIAGVTGDWRTLFTTVTGIAAPAAQTLKDPSGSGGGLPGAIGPVTPGGSSMLPGQGFGGGLPGAIGPANLQGVIPPGYPHASGSVSV